MIALGIEVLGKLQAMQRAEIDAEGATFADGVPNKDRPAALSSDIVSAHSKNAAAT